jgi:hypothetical protein
MKRERLLTQLIRLRELNLKSQSAHLKNRAQHLNEVRGRRDAARDGAAMSLEDGHSLADLVHFGHARMHNARLARKVETEVRALSEDVGHARKLADSAREARDEIRRERISEGERAMETEAEHFFSWKKDQLR